MKIIFCLLLFSLLSCKTTGKNVKNVQPQRVKEIPVRMTVYWPSDYWTKRGLTSTGKRVVHMKTAAIDPKVFPYGSQIYLKSQPPLVLGCFDTGRDVLSRKASRRHGNVPVVDVYFRSKKEALNFSKSNPPVVNVIKL